MSILNREKYFESIRRWLYSIKVEVEGSNKDRHYDINTEMEDLVAGLLNLVYDWKLHNANHDKKNMAGIDLWEDKTGLSRDLVAVQVTSTFERKKVQDTLDKFFRLRDSGELDQRYRKLVVFMLVTKKEYNKSFDTKGEIELQILTFEDLIGELRKRTEKGRLKDLRFLRKVDKYLEINIDREKNRKYWKIICLIAGLGILGSGGSYYLASHNSQTDQKNISTETMPAETESETKLEEPEKETTPPETGTTEPQSETKQVETEKETTPPEKGTTEPQSETKLEEPEKETIPPETRAVEPQSETKLEEPEKETAPQETVATETQPETEWVETEKETPEPETFVVEPESDIPEYIAEPKAQTLVSESQSHNHLVKKSDIHGYQFYIEKPGIFDVDLTCEEKGSNTSRFIITLYDLDHEQEIACTEIPGNIETGSLGRTYLGSGNYEVRIQKGVSFTTADYALLYHYTEEAGYERENNNQKETATHIRPEEKITGNFACEGDVDYYSFTLTHDAIISPTLSYGELKTTDKIYRLSLENEDKAFQVDAAKGRTTEKEFGPYILNAGSYYLRLANPYPSRQDYEISLPVQYVPEVESEPNNDWDNAEQIHVGSSITGRIADENDADVYVLTVEEDADIEFTFSYEPTETADNIFMLKVGNEDVIRLKGTDGICRTDFHFSPGTYYINVTMVNEYNIIYTMNIMNLGA